MDAAVAIPLPLAHVGSVNAWLLHGDPVTLIDTGPRDDEALAALEAGLGRHGLRVEDIELLLATHHHLDHVGLAATIQRRSGATVAVLDAMADYAARYSAEVEEDRRFARALMRHHGVPESLVADTDELLGLHPRHDRGLPRRRAPRRRRSRSGGRAQPPGHRATRPQHDGHAVRRRRRRVRVRRRSPAGDDLLQHGDLRARPGARRAGALARAVPGEPRAHGQDAARAAPHRTRRAGHRAQAAGQRAPARPSPPLRAHPGHPRRRSPHGVRDRLRPVARADGDAAVAPRRLGGGRQPRAAAGRRRRGRAGGQRGLGLRADPCGPGRAGSDRSAAATPPPPGPRLRVVAGEPHAAQPEGARRRARPVRPLGPRGARHRRHARARPRHGARVLGRRRRRHRREPQGGCVPGGRG